MPAASSSASAARSSESIFSIRSLTRALAANYSGKREQDYLNIEPDRPVLDVVQVDLDHFLERQAAAARHLPQACNARFHIQPFAVPDVVFFDLVSDGRTRADHTHVAFQHIQELRKLIKARPPQLPAEARDPRVVLYLTENRVLIVARICLDVTADVLLICLAMHIFVGIHVHRPELVAKKNAPVHPDPLLPEHHRPPGIELDHHRDHEPNRRDNDKREGGNNDVGQSLYKPLHLRQRLAEKPYHRKHAYLFHARLLRQQVE